MEWVEQNVLRYFPGSLVTGCGTPKRDDKRILCVRCTLLFACDNATFKLLPTLSRILQRRETVLPYRCSFWRSDITKLMSEKLHFVRCCLKRNGIRRSAEKSLFTSPRRHYEINIRKKLHDIQLNEKKCARISKRKKAYRTFMLLLHCCWNVAQF